MFLAQFHQVSQWVVTVSQCAQHQDTSQKWNAVVSNIVNRTRALPATTRQYVWERGSIFARVSWWEECAIVLWCKRTRENASRDATSAHICQGHFHVLKIQHNGKNNLATALALLCSTWSRTYFHFFPPFLALRGFLLVFFFINFIWKHWLPMQHWPEWWQCVISCLIPIGSFFLDMAYSSSHIEWVRVWS